MAALRVPLSNWPRGKYSDIESNVPPCEGWMEASLHEGLDGLRHLNADWRSLHGGASVFARYEWTLAAVTHLVPSGSVFFCRISDASDRVVAIVPAFLGNVSVRPFRKMRAISLGLSHELALFDFPMRPDVDAAAVGEAMLRAFREVRGTWDLVHWSRVMADGNAARVAKSMRDSRVVLTSSSVCNTFATTGSPEALFASLPKNMRSNLKKCSKRLAQTGVARACLARDDVRTIARFFDEFLRIEASGWKGREGKNSAVALRPAIRGFYQALLAQNSDEFESDIAVLFVDDRAVAAEFLIRSARWQHVYKIGYDEEFARCSPGQLLLGSVLERACASESIDRVSLVTGMPWHRNWGPNPEPTLEILIFRDHWHPLVLRNARAFAAKVRGVRRRLDESVKPLRDHR
jgi:CelD/BcsL family acetyltransferase involved in cellulose biosynthesis